MAAGKELQVVLLGHLMVPEIVAVVALSLELQTRHDVDGFHALIQLRLLSLLEHKVDLAYAVT